MTERQLEQIKRLVPQDMTIYSAYIDAAGLYLVRCRDDRGNKYDYFFSYDPLTECFQCVHMLVVK